VPSIDTSDPEAVLAWTADEVAAAIGDRALAVFAIGSLAHGGFAPAVSDVDVAVVLADPLHDTDGHTIARVVDRVRDAGGLAARLSLFWSTAGALASGEAVGRFPTLDRLDLARHGRLLQGSFALDTVTEPTTRDLVVDGVRFALGKFAYPDVDAELADPTGLVAQGPRALTKRVLFPVRFLFTAATGEIGRNEAAIDWYVAHGTTARPLVERAGAWRDGHVDREEAVELVRAHLVPLHLELVDVHAVLMDELDEPDLAAQLRTWGDRLRT